jgi:hypothetical protein
MKGATYERMSTVGQAENQRQELRRYVETGLEGCQ